MGDSNEQVVPTDEELVKENEEVKVDVQSESNEPSKETTNKEEEKTDEVEGEGESKEEGEGEEGEGEGGEGEEGEEGTVKKKKKKKRVYSDDDDDEPKVIVIRKIPPSRPLPPPPPKIYDVDKTTWSTAPVSNRVWEVDAEDEYEEYVEPQEDFNEIFSETNFSSEYQFENGDLGTGFFANVKVVANKSNNQIFAAKIVSHEKTGIVPRSFENDFELLQKLNHKNIIKSFASFTSSSHSLVVLEKFGNDLTIAHKYSESETRKIGAQVASALSFLHENKIAHGDIAPENILVSDSLEVKVCGFSCARELTKPLEHGQLIGNAEFQSPEILSRQGYTFSTDIWALGCLLFYLITGTSPFFDNSTIKMQSKIRSATFEFNEPEWKNVSDDFKKFITSILQKNPADRPAAKDLVLNPIFKI